MKRTKLGDDDRHRIIALFLQGERKADIAKVIGCSVSGVYAVLRNAGLITMKRRGPIGHSIRGAARLHGLGG